MELGSAKRRTTRTGAARPQGRLVIEDEPSDARRPIDARTSAVLRIEVVLDERTLQDVSRAIATAYDVVLSLAPHRARGGHAPIALPDVLLVDRSNDDASEDVEPPRQSEPVVIGDLRVDFGAHEVWRGGRRVPLRPKEFALLRALVRAKGCAVTRESLLQEVWGYSEGVFSRTLDTHVRSLRRKLEEDPAAPRHLLTVRTVGFRFAP